MFASSVPIKNGSFPNEKLLNSLKENGFWEKYLFERFGKRKDGEFYESEIAFVHLSSIQHILLKKSFVCLACG